MADVDFELRCYCTSKTRKSESNSQLQITAKEAAFSCYCTSKTRKSESNSQPASAPSVSHGVVIALVKLENLKAIHNYVVNKLPHVRVVIALVKLENLKAIHN